MTEADRSLPFIDTHHHLWDLDRLRYDWLKEPGWADQTESLGDYKMIRSTIAAPRRFFKEFYGANVVKSVHVEAAFGGADAVEETAWLDTVARDHGHPDALVVFCDLEQASFERELERHLEASTRTRGVRLRAHPHADSIDRLVPGCRALVAHNLSYEINASPGRLLSGRELAKRCPDTQMILGHAGFPLQRDADYLALWKSEIRSLALLENVACKVSGLGMADNHWTIDSIRPWVLHCIDAFGPGRIMFGTNWPVDILFATYLEQTEAYRTILSDAGFTPDEQSEMLAGNAERYYRI